jgi:hypothetical protein
VYKRVLRAVFCLSGIGQDGDESPEHARVGNSVEAIEIVP